MKHLAPFFFLIISAGPLSASEISKKLVLLTSLNPATSVFGSALVNDSRAREFNHAVYRSWTSRIEAAAAEWSRRSGFAIAPRVQHEADQSDLERELRDPSTLVLIWLSHASVERSLSRPIADASARIVDFRGYSVEPVFQRALPSLRGLGVVGCASSNGLLPVYREWLPRTRFPELSVYTDVDMASAQRSLELALAHFARTALSPNADSRPQAPSGIPGHIPSARFRIQVRLPYEIRALRAQRYRRHRITPEVLSVTPASAHRFDGEAAAWTFEMDALSSHSGGSAEESFEITPGEVSSSTMSPPLPQNIRVIIQRLSPEGVIGAEIAPEILVGAGSVGVFWRW